MSLTIHTNLGPLKVELYFDLVPTASENFLKLSASGYYDGVTFHRCMAGFMIQCGDPTGTGKGGESVWSGTFADEISTQLSHDQRGVLSMANNGPDTNGSQFFFTYAPQRHLDGKYTIFGQIVDGFDTLEATEEVKVKKKNRPIEDIIILRIEIHANPLTR